MDKKLAPSFFGRITRERLSLFGLANQPEQFFFTVLLIVTWAIFLGSSFLFIYTIRYHSQLLEMAFFGLYWLSSLLSLICITIGRIKNATFFLLMAVWIGLLCQMVVYKGITNQELSNFILVILFAPFLLPKKQWISLMLLSCFAIFLLILAHQLGWVPLQPIKPQLWFRFIMQLSRLLMGVAIFIYARHDYRQARLTLRASEERYQRIFMSTPYPILLFNADLQSFVMWNKQAQKLFGYDANDTTEGKGSAEQVLGKQHFQLSAEKWQELINYPIDESSNPVECFITTQFQTRIFCQITTTRLSDSTHHLLLFSLFDLTERQKSEAELRKQSEIIETVSEAIIVTDSQYTITDWNRGATKIYGWEKVDVVGKSIAKIIPTLYPYEPREQVLSKFLQAGHWQGIAIQKKRDGVEIYVGSSVTMLRDQSGNTQSIIAVNRDLMGLRQVQLALEKAESSLAQLANTMNEVFWLISADGNQIHYISVAYQRITGYDPYAFKENGFWLPITHTDDLASVQSFLNNLRAQKDDTEQQIEHRIITRKGEERWLWSRARLVEGSEEGSHSIVGISADITEEKRTQEQLRETQSQLQLIVDNIPAIVAYIDKEEKFAFVNRNVERFGFNREEIIGSTFQKMVPTANYQRAKKRLHAAFLGEQIASEEEIVLPHANTSSIILQTTYVPHRVNGVVEGVFTFIMDVTAQRKTELSLQRAQKTESLGLLASGVAHDLNNLLVPMITQTSLAMRKIGNEHPAYHHVAKANAVAVRAATLTKQVLAYSGRGQFEIKVIDVNQFIQDSIDLLRISVPSHVQIIPTYGENLPRIRVDIAQFQQILMNLVINGGQAIEAKDGMITIKTSCYKLSAENEQFSRYTSVSLPAGEYILLEIADNGKGVSAEIMDKIFDPFFTTKTQGTGLGLAAVLGIMRGHKGGLDLISKVGEGTQFRLLFPMES